MATKILIVEDELQLARIVELELMHEGYEVAKAIDGREGLSMAESGEYSLILLDLMLPELNGLEVLRRLRKNSNIPVILLTARDSVMDKVSGLDAGADDYITKPFAIEELLARIRVALKKYEQIMSISNTTDVTLQNNDEKSKDMLQCNGIYINKLSHSVCYKDHSGSNDIELTNREYMLLCVLIENKNIVLSRDTLMEKVCGYDYMGETNVIDVYVRYLRNKIDDRFGIKLISTVRGAGYMIKED